MNENMKIPIDHLISNGYNIIKKVDFYNIATFLIPGFNFLPSTVKLTASHFIILNCRVD